MATARKKIGFTLIELLIVVAIIAILAAIAVPNFLEAQIRAKVSRVLADHRSLATAIESYFIDHSTYPPNNNGVTNIDPTTIRETRFIMPSLSTPISYIAVSLLEDPFGQKGNFGVNLATDYEYVNVSSADFIGNALATLAGAIPAGTPSANRQRERITSNQWFLFSRGPDRTWRASDVEFSTGGDPFRPGYSAMVTMLSELQLTGMAYDPSNGTLSAGDVMRTAKGIFAPSSVGR